MTFTAIRRQVRSIPPGKVSTYGQIAKSLGLTNPRLVGYAIRGNQDTTLPCHRVVFKDGSLAPNYSFGGIQAQRKKLTSEGVRFNSQGKVCLANHLFNYDICS